MTKPSFNGVFVMNLLPFVSTVRRENRRRKLKETSASPYTLAAIYAGLGENDKAFEFLEKAYSEKSFFARPSRNSRRGSAKLFATII
jgi:hypothetical protein